MPNKKHLKQAFQKIQVIRAPKHRLATFGTSHINYKLVTDVPGLPDRSRLRIGLVTAQKPAIITPQTIREQFQGFGSEAGRYADALVSHYGEAMRGLEYQFKNEPIASRVELTPPQPLLQQLAREYDRDGDYQKAIISGNEKVWELSLMKFIVEETLSSFATNVRELRERGFFSDARHADRRHREIDNLFRQARADRKALPLLGSRLKEYGLFEEYQDAFFGLLNS